MSVTGWIVATTAALLTIYPPFVILWRHRPISLLAADAFYYLQLARRSTRFPVYTADDIHSTNGFHPLWMWVLSALSRIYPTDRVIAPALVVQTALVAIGVACLAYVIHTTTRRPALSLLLALPGPYFLLFGSVNTNVGNPWSFVNGMESPLSLAIFGVLLVAAFSAQVGSPRWLARAAFGCLLALFVLARLDDALILLAILFVAVASTDAARRNLFRSLPLMTPPAVAIAAYLLLTFFTTGMWLPSSGAEKAHLAVIDNVRVITLALSPYGIFRLGAFGWNQLAFRALLLLTPLAIALWWLVGVRPRRSIAYREQVLIVLAIYCALKGMYNLAIVPLWQQGYWYFPVPLGASALLLADGRFGAAPGENPRSEVTPPPGFWLAALCIGLIGSGFCYQRLAGGFNDKFEALWQERATVAASFRAAAPNADGILECDDGVVSFSLSLRSMSGFGLILDREGIEAKRRGGLLELAFARQMNVIASLYYMHPIDRGASSDEIVAELRSVPNMERERFDAWKWRVLPVDSKSGAVFLEFTPK